MKGIMKSYYLSRYLSHRFRTPTNPSSSITHLSLSRSLSTATKTNAIDQLETKSDKDSLILEKFRQRKLQGSLKTNTQHQETKNSTAAAQVVSKNHGSVEDGEKVVSCFEELGLKEEMVMAAGDMDVWVPTEIQSVAIPVILERKCVLLSSDYGSGRTLAYLLPLLQLLRQDEALSRMKPKHPKAIVLCSTTESSDEGYRVAKLISDFARLKCATESGSNHLSPEDILNSPIGMLIGTPDEVVQQMEEGSIVLDNVKYLVLDDADVMLEHGFAVEINKIITPLKNFTTANNQRLQTVITTSTLTKMVGKSDTVNRLERDNDGKVSAMLLEMEETEVYEMIMSSENLKRKLVEAIESLTTGS
ncbi:DEAD-box ATP-dependent RNA helicase 39-like [Euphorbia lathyris]|uniref:DEAD-box ATP-dependent RNA helicase 39-like n=1 Tax=Euphorbia lathyris TaxID=212925 RepID=UPI003314050C